MSHTACSDVHHIICEDTIGSEDNELNSLGFCLPEITKLDDPLLGDWPVNVGINVHAVLRTHLKIANPG